MDGPIYGMFRAKVVDNKDPEKLGRVLLWIPDFMPLVDQDKGIWARPGNNPVGGRNMEEDSDHHYMGTSYIPKKGSWCFCFFEAGNINRPYYFGALDLENTPVLPENQLGTNYEHKWTVLKTHKGRCIVISDDPDDERVEITGKKRNISEPPTGDKESVYEIDTNMSTILFDEREGKEKVLIRTHKGDFFHVDIDERKLQAHFASDIHIKSDASIYITAEKDFHMVANGQKFNVGCAKDINFRAANDFNVLTLNDINLKVPNNINVKANNDTNINTDNNLNEQAGMNINQKAGMNIAEEAGMGFDMKSGMSINIESGAMMDIKAGAIMNREAGTIINDKAGAAINSDAAMIMDQCGVAGPASAASSADPADEAIDADKAIIATPEGERDT